MSAPLSLNLQPTTSTEVALTNNHFNDHLTRVTTLVKPLAFIVEEYLADDLLKQANGDVLRLSDAAKRVIKVSVQIDLSGLALTMDTLKQLDDLAEMLAELNVKDCRFEKCAKFKEDQILACFGKHKPKVLNAPSLVYGSLALLQFQQLRHCTSMPHGVNLDEIGCRKS